MPVVNYEKTAERYKDNLLNDPAITDKDKADFQRYLNAIDVSPARIGVICNHLRILMQKMPDIVGTMNERDKVNSVFKEVRKNRSDSYLETLRNVGKAFVRWHNDNETPKGWKDIKSKGKNVQRRDLSPEDMITWDEGLEMVNECNSIQITAVIMTQLDGGFRPSEFVDMNFGDVSKKEGYYVIKVSGKTGKRSVLLFKCIPYLQKWLDKHPTKNKNDPLWIMEKPTNRRKELQEQSTSKYLRYNYPALRKRINTLGKRIELDKPLDFYNLRHSAAVIKKLDNIPVDVAALNLGHSVKYFTEVYGRLSLKDLANRMNKAYGITKHEDNKNNPIKCQYCQNMNEPEAEYCSQCNNPLSMNVALKEVKKSKEMENRLKQMENTMNLLKEALGDPEALLKLSKASNLAKSKAN